MEPQTVDLGDRQVKVDKFRAIKGVIAGRLVSRITKEAPGIMEDLETYSREYREKNKVQVTPEMARWDSLESLKLVEADFDRPDGTKRDYIEVPLNPNVPAQIMRAFPKAFELVENEVLGLVALVAIPIEELRKPYIESPEAVDQALRNFGVQLLFEADMDKFVDLFIAAAEVVKEQFAGKWAQLGNALAGFGAQTEATSPAAPEELPEKMLGTVISTPPDGSSEQKQQSSTSSQEPTDGAESTSSSTAETGAS